MRERERERERERKKERLENIKDGGLVVVHNSVQYKMDLAVYQISKSSISVTLGLRLKSFD